MARMTSPAESSPTTLPMLEAGDVLATAPRQHLPRPPVKPSLMGTELATVLASWGEPAYRQRQIAHWLYREYAFDPMAMVDLPLQLRRRLAEELAPFPARL